MHCESQRRLRRGLVLAVLLYLLASLLILLRYAPELAGTRQSAAAAADTADTADSAEAAAADAGNRQDRVAYCFSGGARSLVDLPVYTSIRTNLLDALTPRGNFDTFWYITSPREATMGTYNMTGAYASQQHVHAVIKREFAPQRIVEADDEAFLQQLGRALPCDRTHAGLVLQMWKMQQCMQLVQQHEQAHGVTYSYVVRVRPDFAWAGIPELETMTDEPDPRRHRKIVLPGVNMPFPVSDHFAIVPREHADAFFSHPLAALLTACPDSPTSADVLKRWLAACTRVAKAFPRTGKTLFAAPGECSVFSVLHDTVTGVPRLPYRLHPGILGVPVHTGASPGVPGLCRGRFFMFAFLRMETMYNAAAIGRQMEQACKTYNRCRFCRNAVACWLHDQPCDVAPGLEDALQHELESPSPVIMSNRPR